MDIVLEGKQEKLIQTPCHNTLLKANKYHSLDNNEHKHTFFNGLTLTALDRQKVPMTRAG